jgi:uncharacterized protein involved in exopolysaccharide biosynthesis
MNQQEQLKDDDEISLIEILLFLKANGGNIVKSTSVCLLAGGVYYFTVPKMYEAQPPSRWRRWRVNRLRAQRFC